MSFKKYTGKDKYHFRIYKRNKRHPFVVVMITEEKMENGHYLVSGYMMTHDFTKAITRPKSYVKLNSNPNPKDESDCYLFKKRFTNIKDSRFSKPYKSWHLSKEDEELISSLEKEFEKK